MVGHVRRQVKIEPDSSEARTHVRTRPHVLRVLRDKTYTIKCSTIKTQQPATETWRHAGCFVIANLFSFFSVNTLR